MIPTPPGMCLFCMMGVPHPLDISELILHDLHPPASDGGEPTDDE